MSTNITIRAATPEDAPGIWAALESVGSERKFLGFVQPPTLEEVASFGSLPNVVRSVAVSGDQVVGWIDICRLKQASFAHRGVLGMGIVSQYRRMGIGSRMVEHILERSSDLAVTRIELQVFRSNEPAIRLYEKYGFEVEGQLRGARVLDGVVDDILQMVRFV